MVENSSKKNLSNSHTKEGKHLLITNSHVVIGWNFVANGWNFVANGKIKNCKKSIILP